MLLKSYLKKKLLDKILNFFFKSSTIKLMSILLRQKSFTGYQDILKWLMSSSYVLIQSGNITCQKKKSIPLIFFFFWQQVVSHEEEEKEKESVGISCRWLMRGRRHLGSTVGSLDSWERGDSWRQQQVFAMTEKDLSMIVFEHFHCKKIWSLAF